MRMSEMKIYLAAPFFSKEEKVNISMIENLCDYSGIAYFSPRSEGVLGEMSKEDRAELMGGIFKSNTNHLDECTHMIAIIDNYDTGTVWEMGYFFAKEKPCVSYSPKRYPVNVMLNESILGHAINMQDIMGILLEGVNTEKGSDVI